MRWEKRERSGVWRGRDGARGRERSGRGREEKKADARSLRARKDTRAEPPLFQVDKIPSAYTKLLEMRICGFAKKYRIQSGYWELLEML